MMAIIIVLGFWVVSGAFLAIRIVKEWCDYPGDYETWRVVLVLVFCGPLVWAAALGMGIELGIMALLRKRDK